MEYKITIGESANIEIGTEGVRSILQCLRMLFGTIEGTVFLDRRFGISSEVIDEPLNKMDKLYEEIYTKTSEYESRVDITSIKVNTDNLEGKAKVVVGVKINEEYI